MRRYVRRGRTIIFATFDQHYSVDTVTGCFLWNRATNSKGYGILTDTRTHRLVLAHRLALERKLGREIAPGMMAIHSCDNPLCVNPDHIREGSGKDNCADARERGRAINVPAARNAAKTHCCRGHEYTPTNTRLDANGFRSCRTCQRMWNRRGPRPPAPPKPCGSDACAP